MPLLDRVTLGCAAVAGCGPQVQATKPSEVTYSAARRLHTDLGHPLSCVKPLIAALYGKERACPASSLTGTRYRDISSTELG